MALTSYKIISAATAAALAALVADEITAGNSPVGAPSAILAKEYPAKWDLFQSVAVGVDTVTDYQVVQADTPAELADAVTAAIGDGFALLGGIMVLQPPNSLARGHVKYAQAVFKGTAADAGYGGGGGGEGGPIAIGDVTGLQAALDAKVPTTRTVNGHALSANVTVTAADTSAVPTTTTVNGHALSANVVVSAADITTGTLPVAQVPNLDAAKITGGTIAPARLPIATDSAVGVVKQGTGCTVGGDGTLSVP